MCHVKEEMQEDLWYLDTGCGNHMCGDKKAFSKLDELFKTTVKFGDNSQKAVVGIGTISIQTKENNTHTISDVFFVPDLKTKLISVGQLQEKGYEVTIKDGVCQVREDEMGLVTRVNMTANRLFPLGLRHTTQACFSIRVKDTAWLWNFRYGHSNFGG